MQPMKAWALPALAGLAAAVRSAIHLAKDGGNTAATIAVVAALFVACALATKGALTVLERRAREAFRVGKVSVLLGLAMGAFGLAFSLLIGFGLTPFEPVVGTLAMAAVLGGGLSNIQRQTNGPRPTPPQAKGVRRPARASEDTHVAVYVLVSPALGALLTLPVSIVLVLSDTGGDYGPRGLGTAIEWFGPQWLGFTVLSLMFLSRKRLLRWMSDHPAAVLALSGGMVVAVLTAVVLAMTSVPVAEMRGALVMISLLMGTLAAAAIAVLARRLD